MGDGADLYVIHVQTGETTRLTSAMVASNPSWSPDGRSITFESRAGGRESVWLIDADGSNATELSPGLAAALQPAWSPDGGTLLFSGSEGVTDPSEWANVGYDLYRVNADGSDRAQITDHPAGEWAPAWVAGDIVRYLSSADGPAEVWELDLTTGAQTRLTETNGGGIAMFASPR